MKPIEIDDAAHKLFKFDPSEYSGATKFHGYIAFYHEQRLYSVKDKKNGVTYLIEAKNPFEAIQKIVEMKDPIVVNQNGNNCVHINNVGTLTIE